MFTKGVDALLAHREKITALDLAGDGRLPGSLLLSHFNRARDAGWRILPFTLAKPQGRKVSGRRFANWGRTYRTWRKSVEDRALMDFLHSSVSVLNPVPILEYSVTSTVASLAIIRSKPSLSMAFSPVLIRTIDVQGVILSMNIMSLRQRQD